MNWEKVGYSCDIGVNVISPVNVNNVLGSLRNVTLDDCKVSEQYYSDSRVQATVSTLAKSGTSDGYVNNGRLRIILSIPSRNWSRELITGFVSNKKESYENGYVKRTYTIESSLWGILNHKVSSTITIGKGSKLISIWSSLLKNHTRLQYDTSKAQDRSFNSVLIYEPGSLLSDVLFDISDGYSRMDVTGHGVLTLVKYTPPAKRSATRTLNYDDPRTLSINELSRESNEWSVPGRAIVTSTISVKQNGKSTQQVIAGSYDAPTTHFSSIAQRGYLIARSDNYNGTSDSPSIKELNAVARNNWEDSLDKEIYWDAESYYADYHAGDIITLVPTNLTGRKCLVTGTEINLNEMVQTLRLKEV